MRPTGIAIDWLRVIVELVFISILYYGARWLFDMDSIKSTEILGSMISMWLLIHLLELHGRVRALENWPVEIDKLKVDTRKLEAELKWRFDTMNEAMNERLDTIEAYIGSDRLQRAKLYQRWDRDRAKFSEMLEQLGKEKMIAIPESLAVLARMQKHLDYAASGRAFITPNYNRGIKYLDEIVRMSAVRGETTIDFAVRFLGIIADELREKNRSPIADALEHPWHGGLEHAYMALSRDLCDGIAPLDSKDGVSRKGYVDSGPFRF